MSEEREQLDLLGAASGPTPPEPPATLRWVKLPGKGRLGLLPWPPEALEGLAAEGVGAVLLIAEETPSGLPEAAKEAGLSLRRLATEQAPELDAQVEGLVADVRAGRRVALASADAGAAAFVLGCAALELGLELGKLLRALGRDTLDAIRMAKLETRAAPLLARAEVGSGGAASAPTPLFDRVEADEGVDPAVSTDASARLDPAAIESVERPTEEAAPAPGSPSIDPFDRAARDPRRARLAGAVLGAAIGDAMGHPTEFVGSFSALRERFGAEGLKGYELYWERDGARFAPYTDDTQMAEQVLEALLDGRDRGEELDGTMRILAERFVHWSIEPQGGHRAPGNACLAGCRALAKGAKWWEAGGPEAGGCGSVMRAYPFGLHFAHDLVRAEAWSVAHSRLTHGDPIALAACAAMAVGVARALRDDPWPVVLSEMVAAACRYSPKTAAMMARALEEAQDGVPPETTLVRLEGWAAHEAIAAALYVVARHPGDARAAILEAAFTPGDSDSIATLAGALLGARLGLGGLPAAWVRELERADALLALAQRI